MLQAEFVRDMHNNYIVLKGIEGKTVSYSTRMLLNNHIPGLLATELRCIDQTDLFYYDITSKKSLTEFCETRSLNYNELKSIISSILHVFEECSNYLLSDNDFIIDPKYIFIDNHSMKTGVCHLPGYNNKIQEQLSGLMEYLMNKIDYKDEAAVVMIYAMYKECKEPDCTFESLLRILNTKTSNPKAKSASSDRQNQYKQAEKESVMGHQGNIYEINKDQDRNKQTSKGIITGTQHNNRKVYDQKINRKGKALKNQKRGKRKDKMGQSLYKNIVESPFKKKSLVNVSNQKNIPVEEIESEHEYQYYSPVTFAKAGITAVVGVIILIAAIYLKLLHNDFGTHIDSTKLISFILILGSMETYIMIKLFDSKNKVAGIRTEVEELSNNDNDNLELQISEININANVMGKNSREKNHTYDEFSNMERTIERNPKREIKSRIIYPDKDGVVYEDDNFKYKKDNNAGIDLESDNEQTYEETYNEIKQNDLVDSDEPTQILWMDKTDSDQDATVILAKLSPQKQYRLIKVVNEEKLEISIGKFPFIIGKLKKEVDLTIDDNSVSRRHARLTKVGNDVFLTDLNSTNGTFLNGVKLQENKPYLLTDKDVITFSEVSYTWSESG